MLRVGGGGWMVVPPGFIQLVYVPNLIVLQAIAFPDKWSLGLPASPPGSSLFTPGNSVSNQTEEFFNNWQFCWLTGEYSLDNASQKECSLLTPAVLPLDQGVHSNAWQFCLSTGEFFLNILHLFFLTRELPLKTCQFWQPSGEFFPHNRQLCLLTRKFSLNTWFSRSAFNRKVFS